MKSDDKPLAIFMVSLFIGVLGTILVGWPGVCAAALAISVIAVSGKGQK